MKGLEMACKKPVNETAERDRYLVFSEKGKIIKVTARKLKAQKH